MCHPDPKVHALPFNALLAPSAVMIPHNPVCPVVCLVSISPADHWAAAAHILVWMVQLTQTTMHPLLVPPVLMGHTFRKAVLALVSTILALVEWSITTATHQLHVSHVASKVCTFPLVQVAIAQRISALLDISIMTSTLLLHVASVLILAYVFLPARRAVAPFISVP